MSFQIQHGHTYKLTNAKSRCVLNFSMADFKSVTGEQWDESDNQKWVAEFPRSHAGATRWVFRSVATGLYLGVEEPPRSAGRVIATRDETAWDVRPDRDDPSVFRVMVPNARLGLQFGDKGAPNTFSPGVSAKIWEVKEGEEQRWRFEEA